MLIDLHVRSALSGPGGAEPEAIVARARTVGLGAVAFTERALLADDVGPWLTELGRRHGLAVFLGLEVSTDRGRLLCYPAELDAGWGRRLVAVGGEWPRADDVVAAVTQLG